MFSTYLQKLGQLSAKVNAIKHLRYVQQHVQPQRQQRHQQQLLVQTYRCLSRCCGHNSTPLHINYSGNRKRLCLVLLPLSFVSCASASTGSATSSSYDKNKNQIVDTEKMATSDNYKNAASIYEFTVKDTHGNDVSLEKYKGHVVLVVNIASQCGLTKNNYKKLTELLEKYEEKGLRILNFPCNQFGSQMPEGDGEAMVCHLRDAKANIGDVFQKIDVNGSGTAPLYQFLKAKQGGTLGSSIKWNFTKFLVNKEGIPVNRYAPTTDPMDIVKDIEKLL